MRINVSDLLGRSSLGGTTFTRRRPTSTMANEGRGAPTYTDSTLTGVIQPAATADAQLLPDGTRLSDVQAFFTSGEISPGDGDAALPDLLVDDKGITYRVLHVQEFDKHGLTKALAERQFPGVIPPVPPVTP